MFERLQKPFLTVETGEAYQPIRLSYHIADTKQLIAELNQLKCCEKTLHTNGWNWYWRNECIDLDFKSIESFKKNPNHPVRLGTITIRDNSLYINLPSFKRACLAVTFFNKHLNPTILKIDHADFLNKVFGTDERLPHGFSELLKEDELEQLVEQRKNEYEEIQKKCEEAATSESALAILSEYTKRETNKKLPYAERYSFRDQRCDDPEVTFLGFYIFLRGRELVAIKRWYGESKYALADVAQDVIDSVFGGDVHIVE